MPQEFLASFAVDIDEGGVNRLQSILQKNRGMAAGFGAGMSSGTATIPWTICWISSSSSGGEMKNQARALEART